MRNHPTIIRHEGGGALLKTRTPCHSIEDERNEALGLLSATRGTWQPVTLDLGMLGLSYWYDTGRGTCLVGDMGRLTIDLPYEVFDGLYTEWLIDIEEEDDGENG